MRKLTLPTAALAVVMLMGCALVLSGCSALSGTDTAPSFGGAAVDDRTYVTDQAIEPLELPAAAGGDGALIYSLDPEVPGLTFDQATRTLNGTPTQAGTYPMTYTVTDADDNTDAGDADTLTFTITVQVPAPADTAPSFGGATVDDRTYAANEAIPALPLPAAAGGNGALIYSLEPEVPGLTFDQGTRTLSGAPTQAGTYPMTYTVTDADDNTDAGDADTLTFTITVQVPAPADTAPSFGGATVDDRTYAANEAIPALPLPAAAGGNGALIYSLEPEVPGLTFDQGTRTLSGAPTQAGTYPMTYTVTDADGNTDAGDADTLEFTITVQAPAPTDTAPSFGSATVDDRTYAVDQAIAALPLPSAAGGNGALTYTLDPEVPGLTFDQATRTLSGVPTQTGTYEMTYTVVDADDNADAGDADTLEFTITVQDTAPSFGGAAVDDRTYTVNEAIAALPLPAATGGDGPLTYTLDPEVPGLTFDQATRTLSGVPTQTGTYEMTYTVMDADDNADAGDADTLTFTLRVIAAVSRYRGSGDQVFVLNPDGKELDGARYELDLGDASAEVYLIATNTTSDPVDPEVERLGLGPAGAEGRRAPSRPPSSGPAEERAWITEFNNNAPLGGRSAGGSGRLHVQSRRAVAEGDRFTFMHRDRHGTLVDVPATARSVVTDGATTAAFWVADRDWGPNCRGGWPCVTAEMVDAMADRFFRPGAGNDVHDWVTAIYGEPWGPHRNSDLISPAAAGEIHVLLFDTEEDDSQPCRIAGYFWAAHNLLRGPEYPSNLSAERLIFFLDSVYFAYPEGSTWEVTDSTPSFIISTLAHEFQHMIHYYQKRVLRDAASEVWLNEIASEVAEDLVADKMMVSGPRGVASDDPTAGEPGNSDGRLPYYNLFNDIQVTAWNGVIANYAVNYALGAYLARTYGGAELFRAIVQSDRSGVDAIEAALAALGHDVSFGQVLADWAIATLLSDSTAAPHPYRYNPGTWSTSRSGGERFRLGSINLYHYRYVPPEQPSSCIGPGLANRPAQEGPYLHSLRSFNARTQPPHSNMYATLGRNTGTVLLSVSAGTGNRITVVVKE